MAKYIYHYKVNNVEVTREEFKQELSKFCIETTKDENILCRISFINYEKLEHKIRSLQMHPNTTICYVNHNKSFNISRERKNKHERTNC